MLYPQPHYARHWFDYWQQTPEGRLVLGGRRDKNLEAELTNEETVTDAIQAELAGFATELVGAGARIEHCWAGDLRLDGDQLTSRRPRAGPRADSGSRPATPVAATSMGLACGELVAQAILGSPCARARVLRSCASDLAGRRSERPCPRASVPTRPTARRENSFPVRVLRVREPAHARHGHLLLGLAAELGGSCRAPRRCCRPRNRP